MRCPLLNKDCIREKCAWWATFTVKDIASQEIRSEQWCVVPRIPVLLIELLKHTTGTQAATEEVRNRFDALVEIGRVRALPNGSGER